MDNSELKIVVRALDEASATLKKIGDQSSQMGKTITESNDKSSSSFGGMFKAMLGSQVVFSLMNRGFSELTGFIKDSFAAADESAKVQAQLMSVLHSTGQAAGMTSQELIQLSKTMQNTTTFSDETVLSAENLLLTFTKIGKDVFPQATAAVLDMATAMGTDAKSAAIQVGKALQDPILGVTALRRVGVSFNEEQVKLIKNLVDTGQQLEAQKYILNELSTEFGGSASAAAETFAGKITQLKNKINDVQEVIGGAMEAALYSLVEDLSATTDAALGSEEQMHDLGYEVYSVTNYAIAFGETLLTVARAIQTGFTAIGAVVSGVAGGIAGAAENISSVLQKVGLVSKETTDSFKYFKIGAQEQLQSGIDGTMSSLNAMKTNFASIGPTLSKTRADYDSITKKMQDNITATQKMKTANADAASSVKGLSEAQKKHAEAIENLSEEYEKMSTAGKTNLAELSDSFKDKMRSINDSIASTQASIDDLMRSYGQSQSDGTKSVAEEIVASEQRLMDLKKQLSKATTANEAANLKEQIANEQANYDSSAAFREAHANEIAEAQRRAKETDLQRTIEDYNTKAALDAADYARSLQKLNNEIQDKRNQAAQEQLLYEAKTKAINKMMEEANLYFAQLSNERVQKTTDEVNAQIKLYQQLAAAINQVKSASISSVGYVSVPNIPKHEMGGFVDAPRGTAVPIIAHGGEQIIPAGLNSGGRGGGDITVVINNPSVRNNGDLDNMKKVIEDVMRPILLNAKVIHI